MAVCRLAADACLLPRFWAPTATGSNEPTSVQQPGLPATNSSWDSSSRGYSLRSRLIVCQAASKVWLDLEELTEEEAGAQRGNKEPRGFGVGKKYDTTLEEQLLKELEATQRGQQSRKKVPSRSNSKPTPADEQISLPKLYRGTPEAHDQLPAGCQVQLWGLPKKRSVGKDLKKGFRGVNGLLAIRPVESGNAKTKDPVCEGSGVLVFDNTSSADSFVDRFNAKELTYGRVTKKLGASLKDNETNKRYNSERGSQEGNLAEGRGNDEFEEDDIDAEELGPEWDPEEDDLELLASYGEEKEPDDETVDNFLKSYSDRSDSELKEGDSKHVNKQSDSRTDQPKTTRASTSESLEEVRPSDALKESAKPLISSKGEVEDRKADNAREVWVMTPEEQRQKEVFDLQFMAWAGARAPLESQQFVSKDKARRKKVLAREGPEVLETTRQQKGTPKASRESKPGSLRKEVFEREFEMGEEPEVAQKRRPKSQPKGKPKHAKSRTERAGYGKLLRSIQKEVPQL